MSELQYTILGLYIIMLIIGSTYDFSHNYYIPKDFYNAGLNWFGSYVCFILLMICSPMGLIFRICHLICKIIKWLFTVGHKD